MLWELGDLAGVRDLAQRYGVSLAAIVNWANRYDDFPHPITRVSGQPVYSYQQVAEWRSRHVRYAWQKSPENRQPKPRKSQA